MALILLLYIRLDRFPLKYPKMRQWSSSPYKSSSNGVHSLIVSANNSLQQFRFVKIRLLSKTWDCKFSGQNSWGPKKKARMRLLLDLPDYFGRNCTLPNEKGNCMTWLYLRILPNRWDLSIQISTAVFFFNFLFSLDPPKC